MAGIPHSRYSQVFKSACPKRLRKTPLRPSLFFAILLPTGLPETCKGRTTPNLQRLSSARNHTMLNSGHGHQTLGKLLSRCLRGAAGIAAGIAVYAVLDRRHVLARA